MLQTIARIDRVISEPGGATFGDFRLFFMTVFDCFRTVFDDFRPFFDCFSITVRVILVDLMHRAHSFSGSLGRRASQVLYFNNTEIWIKNARF